jgi:ADP-dependent phosphofructokinase/glucokinase
MIHLDFTDVYLLPFIWSFLGKIEEMGEEKIALGLGNNIDYEFAWDSAVLEELIIRLHITAADIRDAPVENLRSLIISILNFAKHSQGGQRFLKRSTVTDEYAKWFSHTVTIGGTCPRAAIAMSTLGYRSRLHLVTDNEQVRRFLPRGASLFFSNDRESLYPHLIIQYDQDTKIDAGDIHIVTSRANRIIYDNDPDNTILKLNPAFFDNTENIQVCLVSGFNTMRDKGLLASRLNQLGGFLKRLPPGVLVFYEDAGFYNSAFPGIVQDTLRRYIHIYSLNEDELMGYGGEQIDFLNPPQVYVMICRVMERIGTPLMVIHTKYWALACGEAAAQYRRSLRGGIIMATTRFRFGDAISEEKYRLTGELPADRQGSIFSTAIEKLGGNRICCEASLSVPETRVTTIGLGDAFVGGFLPTLVV